MTISNIVISATILLLIYIFLSLIRFVVLNVILPTFFSKRKDVKKYGNWVVVTGATDGIGRAFAELLSQDGYNLVLIGRSEEKLDLVRRDLLTARDIKIIVIKADFTKLDIYDSIRDNIKGLQIGMLINNVGMMYPSPNYLISDSISETILSEILHCNCLSAVVMTKVVLETGMIDRGGFILNISSIAGLLPAPFLSAYGASKSFVNSFSLSMQSELKKSRVVVQNFEPLVVSTNMARVKPSMFVPSAKLYANGVLDRIGTCTRSHGCFRQNVVGSFMTAIPQWMAEKMIYFAFKRVRETLEKRK